MKVIDKRGKVMEVKREELISTGEEGKYHYVSDVVNKYALCIFSGTLLAIAFVIFSIVGLLAKMGITQPANPNGWLIMLTICLADAILATMLFLRASYWKNLLKLNSSKKS